MLTSIYIDNFKCLSNFEFSPGPLRLLIGRNGTGKSTVFEVLGRVREFVLGANDTAAAFPIETLTRWDTRDAQSFVLDVECDSGAFRYRLEIEHDRRAHRSRVAREELVTHDQQPLFSFLRGDVHLYRDNHSAGPEFPADWSRSALATVPPRHDNTRLTAFKRSMEQLRIVSPDPRHMEAESRAEAGDLVGDASNFVSWYRHALQEQTVATADLFKDLAHVIDGLAGVNLQKIGDTARRMTVALKVSPTVSGTAQATEYGFDELSDGQRALIALYSLLHLGLRSGSTLCIDEPDNYLALAEIQPWLVALRERVEDAGTQVLLVSHNREVINYLARDAGVLFEREAAGPVRVRPFEYDETWLPAEAIARGWE